MSASNTIIISLGGTLVINVLSVLLQHWLGSRSRQRNKKRSWYTEVRADCRELRRKLDRIPPGLNVDPSNMEIDAKLPPSTEEDPKVEQAKEDFQGLVRIVDNLDTQFDKRPDGVSEELETALRDLLYWFEDPDPEGEFTTIEVRQELRDRLDRLLTLAENDL